MKTAAALRSLMLAPLLGTALFTVTGALAVGPALAAEPAIIYVTRHGERAGEMATDPDLTPQGQARARHLATLLRTAGIAHIFSTATRRTRQTAQPLATGLALEVQIYDPAQPGKLVDQVKGLKSNALVVGHSNTVPELVKQFGGKPVSPIGDMEYDRLYQLIIAPDGTVTTVLLHSVAQ